jgi:hypothetical protein
MFKVNTWLLETILRCIYAYLFAQIIFKKFRYEDTVIYRNIKIEIN